MARLELSDKYREQVEDLLDEIKRRYLDRHQNRVENVTELLARIPDGEKTEYMGRLRAIAVKTDQTDILKRDGSKVLKSPNSALTHIVSVGGHYDGPRTHPVGNREPKVESMVEKLYDEMDPDVVKVDIDPHSKIPGEDRENCRLRIYMENTHRYGKDRSSTVDEFVNLAPGEDPLEAAKRAIEQHGMKKSGMTVSYTVQQEDTQQSLDL